MKKRILPLCLVLCLASIANFGGASAGGERTGDPIELNFFSLNSAGGGAKDQEAMAVVEQKIFDDLGINCHINISTADSFAVDQIPVKIAAGELDALSSNMGFQPFMRFIDKGMLIQLDDLIAEYGEDIYAQVAPNLWSPYAVDGKTYLIPIQSQFPFSCSTWLRMDLFRKYGIDKIPDTVDELLEGIRTVVANEPGMVGLAASHISWMFNSGPLNYHYNYEGTGHHGPYLLDDGTLGTVINVSGLGRFWLEDPDMIQHLQRVRDLYKDGILDPQIFTTTFDHGEALFAEDRVVCIGEGYSLQRRADRKAGLDPDYEVEPGKEQEWVMLTHLVNDINGAPTTWQYMNEPGMFFGIVATTKYAEEIMKIFNWFCASEENYKLATWGVEGEHWYYDDNGKVTFVRDDAGTKVVSLNLGGMMQNFRSDWWGPLYLNYYGTEYLKIFATPPVTKTWSHLVPALVFERTDATTITDLDTISTEAIHSILMGQRDLEEGLEQMVKDLKSAGYDDYHAEWNELFFEAFKTWWPQ